MILDPVSRDARFLLTYLLPWVLFSGGLWLLFRKLPWKKRYMAWLPGVRWYALGASVEMEKEGAYCGGLEVLFLLVNLTNLRLENQQLDILFSLAELILVVMELVLRIRIFLRLSVIFSMRKRWVLLWVFSEGAVLLILALAKRYQMRSDWSFTEEWEAGTAPAALSGAGVGKVGAGNEGLSVELRERTARDFSKKRYLLKDIALEIPNGSLVMLLGGSGSGKTTFVNAVIGYEKADAEIVLNGTDVYKDYDRVKHRIGFVPQQNLIRGSDTVKRTVHDAAELRMPADLSSESRSAKIAEVMDLLGIRAGSDGLVSKKSGGQLRRISIAMELVADPELFVLDEPDSGLDGVIAREIFTRLRAIADEGKIVIAITHTPDRVVDLFDKVIVLARDSGRVGRLAFYGSPQEAREFFGRDTMEGIVMCVNRREEGGDGMADEFIRRYAEREALPEGGAAV